MFDLEIEIKIPLGVKTSTVYEPEMVPAIVYIRLLGGSPSETKYGRWMVVGTCDHRLPNLGKETHHWHWETGSHNKIVLETHKGHSWAWLDGFPNEPNINSGGNCEAFNMPGGPCKWNLPSGHYMGDWGVRFNKQQRHIADINEVGGALGAFTSPTGWEYDTSAGLGGGKGGVGVGGGVMHGYVIFKRSHAGKVEKIRVNYDVAGVGLITPGVGAAGAGEGWPSTGSKVCRGPSARPGPFEARDFVGGITIADIGASGSFGGGFGYDGLAWMFTEQILNKIPNPGAIKAHCLSRGLSSTAGLGPSAQGLIYVGNTSIQPIA